jgi:hypothetical protein
VRHLVNQILHRLPLIHGHEAENAIDRCFARDVYVILMLYRLHPCGWRTKLAEYGKVLWVCRICVDEASMIQSKATLAMPASSIICCAEWHADPWVLIWGIQSNFSLNMLTIAVESDAKIVMHFTLVHFRLTMSLILFDNQAFVRKEEDNRTSWGRCECQFFPAFELTLWHGKKIWSPNRMWIPSTVKAGRFWKILDGRFS